MAWLLTFDDVVAGKHGTATVGGKGRQLADMHAMQLQGASVPFGSVVPTSAYRHHLRALGLEARFPAIHHITKTALDGLRDEVTRIAVHADLRAAIRRFVEGSARALGPETRFAVRSSGAAEDGAAASFAGQYESVLNVRGAEAVERAVLRVWSSCFSEHIIPYLQQAGSSGCAAAASRGESSLTIGGIPLPDMAVVIQLQVASESSGVLFTVDPTAAGDTTMIAEAVWGQGEGLVSGEITPCTSVVNWAPPLWESGGGGGLQLVRERRVRQSVKFTTLPAGDIGLVPTSVSEAAVSPLSPQVLSQLVSASLEIAGRKGWPQDIEWCTVAGRLFVVQTRPVTRYSFRRTLGAWGLCLASASCLLDESLVCDGFREFIECRFPAPRLRLTGAEVTLSKLGFPPAAAAVPGTQVFEARCPAVHLSLDGLLPENHDIVAAALREAGSHLGSTPLEGFGAGAAPRPANTSLLTLTANLAPILLFRLVLVDANAAAGAASAVARLAEQVRATLPGGASSAWGLVVRVQDEEQLHAASAAAGLAGAAAVVAIVPASRISESASRWLSKEGAAPTFCVAATADVDALVPAAAPLEVRLLPAVAAAVEVQRSRVMQGRMYNNLAIQDCAERQRWVPLLDPHADVHAANEAFRRELMPALEDTCARLLEKEAQVASPAPLPPLFPSPVAGATVLRMMCAYRDATCLSWTIGIPAAEHQAEFEAAWAAVAPTAAGVGIQCADLLAGLTSRNALDELQGLGAQHAGNAALVALCAEDEAALPDGALAGRIVAAGSTPAPGGGGGDAPPLAAVAAQLRSYLTHYGHMADNDEDLNSTHWIEDSSFPLGILRKIVLARRGQQGFAAPLGAPAAPPAPPPPAAPPLLHRASSTAPADSYESARELLDGLLRGPDSAPGDAAAADALWARTELLRRSLLLKERVHGQHVRIGLQVKLLLRQWIRERREQLGAAWAAVGGGEAEVEAALFHAPFPHWARALAADDAWRAAAPSLPLAPEGAPAAAAAPSPLPHLLPLAHAALRFSRERGMWRRVHATVTVRGDAAKGSTLRAGSAAADEEGGGGGDTFAAAAALPRSGGQQQLLLHGLGCSTGAAGAVCGLARVVPSLDAARHVRAGEVLVTRVTSPAWTPLFSLVTALVLEEGGMLSHGAVVARECGIPAVSQVATATRAIRTGDMVIVDGAAGTVTVIPAADDAPASVADRAAE